MRQADNSAASDLASAEARILRAIADAIEARKFIHMDIEPEKQPPLEWMKGALSMGEGIVAWLRHEADRAEKEEVD
jgi:hypothetical protein